MTLPNYDKKNGTHCLKTVTDLSPQYQHVFSNFRCFNLIQSQLMDEILYTDSPVVVSAPTGSGKTVLFEFSIIRLLEKCQKEEESPLINKKIVYLAPVKALCTERFNDWESKFCKLGLKAIEVTGDSDEGNLLAIQHFNLVLTTPEKWDSLTRKWRDHTSLVSVIKLILIDEVHLLNEGKRGSTLEAVVSRMKTIAESSVLCDNHIRFLAVSATIPNIEDVAAWLGKKNNPAKHYKFGEEMRPVHLNKVVKTFPFRGSMSYYKFDLNLSYKLKQIILDYAEGKPALIFCSTRKAVLQTSTTILQNITFHFTPVQKMTLEEARESLVDSKLRDMVKYGVGFHHAGLSASDRHNIEELFKSGFLPILVSTSTLAMGVNLPAHLVIIKSTAQYINGTWEEYSEGQILQMMGRAGRPQFDSSATAVILTKDSLKEKYEKLASGKDVVESNLHQNLAEHLNSEIVLRTITDIAVAVHWLRSTFFYIRALKNPRYYGIPDGIPSGGLETRLQAICMRELNGLEKYELIKKTDFAYNVEPTENGKLMARLYIAFETMKLFMKVKGKETIPQMLELICQCHEFSDIQLRVNERNTLNLLNKNKAVETIRFPLNGRIKTKEMKINCLIQAILGCLPIQDNSLTQESVKILRIADRIAKALSLYLWQRYWYEGLASALILTKSITARMWENSCYVSRQLPGIGPALASLLVSSRKTSFKSIIESNPRDLERIINKHPPMGNSLQETAKSIPQYSLELNYQKLSKKLYISLKLVNFDKIMDPTHTFNLLVAGSNNELLRKEKIRDTILIEQKGEINFMVKIQPEMNIEAVIVHLISDKLVGVDLKKVVAIFSKYEFFSQEEAGNFYTDEESVESSEKSYEEKPVATVQQKKSIKKVFEKKQSLAKEENIKVKTNSKSKYQTSLSQYAFKSTRGQLKHYENEKNASDNEVSSTQDHILKYNSSPKFIDLKNCVGTENKNSACTLVEPSYSKTENRMKMDTEYKCYIEKSIEISAKTVQSKVIKKITPSMDNDSAVHCENCHSHFSNPKFENAQNNESIKSNYNLHKLEEPCYQKYQSLSSHENAPVSGKCNSTNCSQNIHLLKENESNFDIKSSHEISNYKAGYNSNKNINNSRKPFQLSPRQFLKSSKHIQQKLNVSHKSENKFFPLFMPLDKIKEDINDKTEGVKKKYEESCDKDNVSNVQENYVNSLKNCILDPKIDNLLQGKLSPKKGCGETGKSQKYNMKHGMETGSFSVTGKVLQKKSNKKEISSQNTKYNSTNCAINKEMMRTNQVCGSSMTETTRMNFKRNFQEDKEICYSQLDDLFFDSPEMKEREATNLEKPLTEATSNDEDNRSVRSPKIEDIELIRKETLCKHDISSPMYGVHDFTKKRLDFGRIMDEIESLPIDEIEPCDNLDDGSDSEQKSLRSDYGDPFAPVHSSTTYQKLFKNSNKENILKETLVSYIKERNSDSYHQMKSCEFVSSMEPSTKDFENTLSKQIYENIHHLRMENQAHDQLSQPQCLPIKKTKLNNSSVKNFFPIHKDTNYKNDSYNYTSNELNDSKTYNGFQCHLVDVHPSYGSVKNLNNSSKNLNEVQSFYKDQIDLNSHSSPKKIDSLKRRMLQSSFFSQKSKPIKKVKSDYSESNLTRLSNLLYDKRRLFKKPSVNNFQSALNLMSPMTNAFRSVPHDSHQSGNMYDLNVNNNQASSSGAGQLILVNTKPKEPLVYNFNPSPTVVPQICFSSSANNNVKNYSMQQNYNFKPINEQPHEQIISKCHYEEDGGIQESSRMLVYSEQACREQPSVPLSHIRPVTFNDTDQSLVSADTATLEESTHNISFDENMLSSPSLGGSLQEELPSSPLSGEYFQKTLAMVSSSTKTFGCQTPSTFKLE